MPLDNNTHYSFDSSSLIHAWNRAYRPENFPSFWANLDKAISAGIVVASIEVLNELSKKDDAVFEWCKLRAANLFVEIDDEQQNHMIHLMGQYPRLVDTVKGKSGGDPFVIALALQSKQRITVVSEEDFGKKDSPRIPDVCFAEGVRCCKLADFIQDQNWRF